ncbi:MAG: insulinase family protein [Clostridia bacterium]|nr:insulinase family protein [Clostridia bacterium]
METLNINGIKVSLIPDNRLKTAALTVYISLPLNKDAASFNALWPAVLMRGCKKYPETKELNIYMEQLFGATAGFRVEKQGANQLVSMRFKTVSDVYAEGKPFTKLIRLAGEILFNPLIENGAFRKSYTDREKQVQIQYIEGLVNDKRKYAATRLIQEMCKDEEYSILACGEAEKIEKIDEKALYESYISALKEGSISVYVTDHFDKDEIVPVLEEVFANSPHGEKVLRIPVVKEAPEKVKTVEEKAPVTQGKLSMGFRTSITRTSQEYYAMMLFNKLFGGSPYSKLFLNVREKLSLAYYASSTYGSLKGIVTVNSGIEFEKYEAAKNEILVQLNEMKKGNFTEDEINAAKLDIENSYKEISDYGEALSEYYSYLDCAGISESPSEVVAKIKTVTKEQIVNAAKTVNLDTVYFLKGEE